MPRPGPRPYECVKRAWHSERHQPMRGSIIQQIFRSVHESHTLATKKNREWQEKLPVVVLKAEEIMYSKANSEDEYTNLETLWDRVNEAIDTIIRRDESSETGDLLPPCVEAALHLGCVPVRASRSQRHNIPRSYLTPRVLDRPSVPPRLVENSLKSQTSHIHHTNPDSQKVESLFPHRNKARKFEPTSRNGSVYPLYYGTPHAEAECSKSLQMRSPIVLQNLFFRNDEKRSCESAEANAMSAKCHEFDCDLSLRLGVPTTPSMGAEKCLDRTKHGPFPCLNGSRFVEVTPHTEFCFTSMGDRTHLPELLSPNWCSKSETSSKLNASPCGKEGERFWRHLGLESGHCSGQFKRPG